MPKSNLSEVGGNFEARELGLASFFLIWTNEKAPGCPIKNSKLSSYPTPLALQDFHPCLIPRTKNGPVPVSLSELEI